MDETATVVLIKILNPVDVYIFFLYIFSYFQIFKGDTNIQGWKKYVNLDQKFCWQSSIC